MATKQGKTELAAKASSEAPPEKRSQPEKGQKKSIDDISADRVVVGGVPQRKVMYKWQAPQRYFKKLNKRIFIIALACVLAFFIMLILLGQYFLMAAIAAVMFLIYVVGTVEPVKVPHVITNLGIETAGSKYEWEKLETYWFAKRDTQTVLYVDTNMSFPGRLIMLVGPKDMKETHVLLSKVLPYLDYRGQNRASKSLNGEWIDMLKRDTVEKKGK